MRAVFVAVFVLGICVPGSDAQTSADAAPEALVKLWFERWNASPMRPTRTTPWPRSTRQMGCT